MRTKIAKLNIELLVLTIILISLPFANCFHILNIHANIPLTYSYTITPAMFDGGNYYPLYFPITLGCNFTGTVINPNVAEIGLTWFVYTNDDDNDVFYFSWNGISANCTINIGQNPEGAYAYSAGDTIRFKYIANTTGAFRYSGDGWSETGLPWFPMQRFRYLYIYTVSPTENITVTLNYEPVANTYAYTITPEDMEIDEGSGEYSQYLPYTGTAVFSGTLRFPEDTVSFDINWGMNLNGTNTHNYGISWDGASANCSINFSWDVDDYHWIYNYSYAYSVNDTILFDYHNTDGTNYFAYRIDDESWAVAFGEYASSTRFISIKLNIGNATEDVYYTLDYNQAPPIDSTLPTYSGLTYSSTIAGKSCSFGITATDNVGLSKYVFSTNNTGTWVNDTAIAFSNVSSSWLHTDGTRIKNGANEEVIFNGMDSMSLFGYISLDDDTIYLTAANVDTIRSHNINYIRVDVSMDMALRHQAIASDPYNLNYWADFWTALDAVVNESRAQGVYISIDFGVSDGCWSNIGGSWGTGNGFPDWMYNGSWAYQTKTYPTTLDGQHEAMYDFWNISVSESDGVRAAYDTFWKDISIRYRDYPNVIYSLFNEPMCNHGNVIGSDSEWHDLLVMYRYICFQTIDDIRIQEVTEHLVDVNLMFPWYWDQWYWNDNLQVTRSNVIVDGHLYMNSNISASILAFANLAWRYSQPFLLGEYGGIEESLQYRSSAITTMQVCNTYNISRAYLRFDTTDPSAQTWTDLNTYKPSIMRYYSESGSFSTVRTVSVTKTLTSIIGVDVGYRWYINDTSDNWNSSAPQYLTTTPVSLTVASTTYGTTNPVAGSYPYAFNNTVIVTAIPANSSMQFDYWLINGTTRSTSNPRSFIITSDLSYAPVFSAIPAATTSSLIGSLMPMLILMGLAAGAIVLAKGSRRYA